ncbi:cupin domain-containing protein [Pseudomonas monteilii]|uniref:cupin domain-containing protein n=1 Tax=Pseudomonas monteilii TaxID=76759 RepID=UPI003839FDF3
MSNQPDFPWGVRNGHDVQLERWPLDPQQVLQGNPETSGHVIWSSADKRQQCGIWEITPGTVTDVECAELIVVLYGRATVTTKQGQVIELHPGSVATWPGGTVTEWVVHERLRKAYYLVKNDPVA